MGFGGEDVACAGAEGAAEGGQGCRLSWVGGSEAAPGYSVEDVGADVHVGVKVVWSGVVWSMYAWRW
jgi:hypothetical protein